MVDSARAQDQVAEIIGKINENQIRLIEGVPEDILGRLEVDLDYRNGYVEGLKSLSSTAGVEEEKKVRELDGYEKMRF